MQRNVSSQHCNQSRDLLNIRNTKESGYNEKKNHQKTNPKFLLCFVHFTEKPPTILNKPTLMPVPVAGGTVRRVSHFRSELYPSAGYKNTALSSQKFQLWKIFHCED